MLRELCKNINFMKVQPCENLYPTVEDREFWDKVAKEFGAELEKIRENIEATPRTVLTASMYLEFSRNGNRSNYQTAELRRRTELVNKSFLECCYNDGRYLTDIIDLVWMILEETTWTLPAHNKCVDTADGLPDYERHSLDIGVVRTADILAFVYQVLGSKMDEVSKVITRRIQRVIKKVVFQDFLARDDYWWMGMLGPDRGLNNICTWLTSYTLRCAHILEDDLDTFRKIVLKAIYALDSYLDKYPEDGACNEGPAYWRHAVGCAIEAIESLNLATNGGFQEVLTSRKLKNMGEVLSAYHVNQNIFVNFGDCKSLINVDTGSYFHYGKLLESPKMCHFAVNRYKEQSESKILFDEIEMFAYPIRSVNLFRYHEELKGYTTNSELFEKDYYYPSMHYLVVKPNEYNDKFLAFKGCHNKQSHNHNDVGSFIVCKNGVRYLIDTGHLTYTKDTFNENRYTIWTNRSEYHNLPIINGHGQMKGMEYAATDVEYNKTETAISLSMNIKEAYENRDEIHKWIRKMEYSLTSNEIVVTEDFAFAEEIDYTLCFMTPQRAEYQDGVLTLKEANGEELQLVFEHADFDFRLEEMQIADSTLKKNWGDCLYRVQLCARAKERQILYRIR